MILLVLRKNTQFFAENPFLFQGIFLLMYLFLSFAHRGNWMNSFRLLPFPFVFEKKFLGANQ